MSWRGWTRGLQWPSVLQGQGFCNGGNGPVTRCHDEPMSERCEGQLGGENSLKTPTLYFFLGEYNGWIQWKPFRRIGFCGFANRDVECPFGLFVFGGDFENLEFRLVWLCFKHKWEDWTRPLNFFQQKYKKNCSCAKVASHVPRLPWTCACPRGTRTRFGFVTALAAGGFWSCGRPHVCLNWTDPPSS